MKKMVFIVLFLLSVNGCSINAIYHDEDEAIEISSSFLRDLIHEDYRSAYDTFLSSRLKNNVQFGLFESDLKQNQYIRGRLKKAVFDSFQLVPGQKAIQLYYNVTHEKAGDVMYHFVLEGDGKAGYKIIVLDIGNQMRYPPNMRLVGVKRMKKDRYIEVKAD